MEASAVLVQSQRSAQNISTIMAQHGYAVVDVDEDPANPSQSSGLEFQTFLPSQTAGSQNRTAAPDVPYSPFNLAYYQTYFDVETDTVLKRVGMAMIPRPGFVAEVCDGQIDMYGPFWTLTTLILVLYTTSTLTASISQYINASHASSNLPLLSTATSAVYVYGLLVPAALWGTTKWLSVGDWRIAEPLGIYGYSMSVFIPVSLLCLIPIGILRWALIAIGAISSGYFLTGNIYPILASSDNKFARLLIVGVAVLHGAMALTIKVLFFGDPL